MATFPAARASLVKSDSITLPPGIAATDPRGRPRIAATIRARLYAGYASDGYQTDYQRREVRWVETESFDPDGKTIRRCCHRFAGRSLANAERDYRQILVNLAKEYPGQPATFPTTAAA